MTADQLTAILDTIQHDPSGVGHSWRTVGQDLPANTREEIAAEIIDGGRKSCDRYRASSGERYRWGLR